MMREEKKQNDFFFILEKLSGRPPVFLLFRGRKQLKISFGAQISCVNNLFKLFVNSR